MRNLKVRGVIEKFPVCFFVLNEPGGFSEGGFFLLGISGGFVVVRAGMGISGAWGKNMVRALGGEGDENF